MKLKEYVFRQGFKQLDLSLKTGINHSQLCRFLNGWHQIPRRHIESLSRVLGISEDEIVAREVNQEVQK